MKSVVFEMIIVITIVNYSVICQDVSSETLKDENVTRSKSGFRIKPMIESTTPDPSDPNGNWIIHLKTSNLIDFSAITDIIIVYFYADWCPYSKEFYPKYQDAAKEIKINEEKYSGSIIFGMVDGVKQKDMMSKFHVRKFPTIKTIIHGKIGRHEYRGPRNSDGIIKYAEELLLNPVMFYDDEEKLAKKINSSKLPAVVFRSILKPSENDFYLSYSRTARGLRSDCDFFWISSKDMSEFSQWEESVADSEAELNVIKDKNRAEDSIQYIPHIETNLDPKSTYRGIKRSYKMFSRWASELCDPIVTEIHYENAEEITEEGLPLLIFFLDPKVEEHKVKLEQFFHSVHNELSDSQINSISTHFADGLKFEFALRKFNKSSKDLPLIALDDFKHMYLYPIDHLEHLGQFNVTSDDDEDQNEQQNNYLRKFIDDFESGKLHDDYHQEMIQDLAQAFLDTASGDDEDSEDEYFVETEDGSDDQKVEIIDASLFGPEADDEDDDDDDLHEDSNDADENEVIPQPEPEFKKFHVSREFKVKHNPSSETSTSPKTMSTPPQSVFSKLAPSDKRYTLIRDEL